MSAQGSNVRIPPDSTGKLVSTVERQYLEYDNLTGTILVGDVVTGAVSSATGTVTGITTAGFPSNSGSIYLDDASGTWVNNESIEISAAGVALVNTTNTDPTNYHYQKMIVADPDNPSRLQKIDEFGAQKTTFSEGSPQISPFGQLMTTDSTTVGSHAFVYGLGDEFYTNISGGGSVTWSSDDSAALLTCGTANADIAQITTNMYHTYRPGNGLLIEMSVVIGDTGKANCRRRWGFFDNNNGLFWELDGTSLYTVVRSKSSGSVIDTRVAQANFSDNRLDGSDTQGFELDVSKTNIYWIDFQWLGSGRINFGVFRNTGDRILAHQVQNSNINTRTFMQTGTLPLRFEQYNTALTGSTSEMKSICSTVKSTGVQTYLSKYFSNNTPTRVSVAQSDGEVPLISIRPQTTFGGRPNHVASVIDSVIVDNSGDKSLIIRLRKNATLGGGTAWSNNSTTSSAEVDTSSTTISGGSVLRTGIVAPGAGMYFTTVTETGKNAEGLAARLLSDNTTQEILTMTGQVVDNTGSANTVCIINWGEEHY